MDTYPMIGRTDLHVFSVCLLAWFLDHRILQQLLYLEMRMILMTTAAAAAVPTPVEVHHSGCYLCDRNMTVLLLLSFDLH